MTTVSNVEMIDNFKTLCFACDHRPVTLNAETMKLFKTPLSFGHLPVGENPEEQILQIVWILDDETLRFVPIAIGTAQRLVH